MAIFADLFGAQQEMLPIAFANLKTSSGLASTGAYYLYPHVSLEVASTNALIVSFVGIGCYGYLWYTVLQEPVSPSSKPCVLLDSIADADDCEVLGPSCL